MADIISALVAGIACGLIAWGAIRTEVRFLWRDVERSEKRMDKIEERVERLEQAA